MKLPILPISVLTLQAMILTALAQDPGFRIPADSRASSPSPAPSYQPTMSAGDLVQSAGVINSMEVLDNTQPIESGDIVSLRILEDHGEPLQLRVGATGEINVPHIGLIRAAGKTCRQVAFEAKRELERSYYKNATVIIAIDLKREDDPNSRMRTRQEDMEFFTVFGQVLRQGKYELPSDEDVTISQAVLRAGGPAQFANMKKVKLVRKTPQGNKTILINLDDVMRKGNLDKDIYVRNNDVVILDEVKVNF